MTIKDELGYDYIKETIDCDYIDEDSNSNEFKLILQSLKLRDLLEIKLKESTLFTEAIKKKFNDTSYVPLDEINKAIQELFEESKK